MVDIKVLGAGCANCQKVEDAAKTAVAILGADAQISKITDYAEINTKCVILN